MQDIFSNRDGLKLSKKFKILLFAGVGNCLELYDYALYAVMLPFISPLFFPSEESSISLLLGYLSFAIAFIFAPLGSIFWGWFGDKYGRTNLLKMSMIFMAIPSILIAILPTVEIIGIGAPIVLIVLRIMQGISASGEVKGSKIFAMEYLGPNYFGLASGILTASGAFGVLLAMAMAYFVSINQQIENIWRIPFALGGVIYFVAIMLRRNISERIINSKKINVEEVELSLKMIIKTNFSSSKIVFFLGGVLGVLSYMMHAFLPPYVANYFAFNFHEVYLLSISAYVATIISAIIIGLYVTDKVVKFLVLSMDIITVSTPFLFMLLYIAQVKFAIFAYIFLGINLGAFSCLSSIMMYRVFPTEIRCRGVLFNYALGVGIFGGLTPAVLQLIALLHYSLPPIIVVIFVFIVRSWMVREGKNVSLY